jgi:hypothetical protein
MTDVKEQETVTATEWKDSNGSELVEGDRVYIAVDQARGKWDFENDTYVTGRAFDFGEVESLNEDGTVSVWWDAAGCSCNSENGPSENPSHLTKLPEDLTDEVREIAYLSNKQGYRDGVSQSQSDIRSALGLSDPTDKNDN